MKKITFIHLTLILSFFASCTSKNGEVNTANDTSNGLKTIELVAQDWPGQEAKRYAMPVHSGLDKLEFADSTAWNLADNDLVLGIVKGDSKIAVPLAYLEGFEVANLSLDGEDYLITWCGLVGSAQMFKSNIEADIAGFDFGQALINNNLLMVDRQTQSVWNQLSNEAIHGQLKGARLALLPTLQTTWNFWKDQHPETKVLINKDTTGAAFPSLLFTKPYYTSWQPDSGRFYMAKEHLIENLGLGLKIEDSSIYFPLETLFKKRSPVKYEISDQTIIVHFDKEGLTAWAKDSTGMALPGTLAYDWAWKSFYPKGLVFEE